MLGRLKIDKAICPIDDVTKAIKTKANEKYTT